MTTGRKWIKTLQTAKRSWPYGSGPYHFYSLHDCNKIQWNLWKSKQTFTPYIGIDRQWSDHYFVTSDRIAAHNLHTFELVDLFLSPRHCRQGRRQAWVRGPSPNIMWPSPRNKFRDSLGWKGPRATAVVYSPTKSQILAPPAAVLLNLLLWLRQFQIRLVW